MGDYETELNRFNKRLKTLATEIQVMKKVGISEELLVPYLKHKLKISEKKARQIIVCYEDFYGEFLKTAIAKEMCNETKK